MNTIIDIVTRVLMTLVIMLFTVLILSSLMLLWTVLTITNPWRNYKVTIDEKDGELRTATLNLPLWLGRLFVDSGIAERTYTEKPPRSPR